MSNWTQAVCDARWNQENPDRQVTHTEHNSGVRDTCCYCGGPTCGIYVRVDPATVPYPRAEP